MERSSLAPFTLKPARGIVEKARQLHRTYLKESRTQKPDEELLGAAIDLAQLDLVKRNSQLFRYYCLSCIAGVDGCREKVT